MQSRTPFSYGCEEERDKDDAKKDASSLGKASSADYGSSGADNPQNKGITRNMKKTEPAVGKQDLLRENAEGASSRNEETKINNVPPSENPDVLPQVHLSSIQFMDLLIYHPSIAATTK